MMNKLIYGFGINDWEGKTQISGKIEGKWKAISRCKFYQTWRHMIERCYNPEYHKKRPTYSECYVDDDWKSFKSFRIWMSQQEWKGAHLDKDLLFPGNKVYSSKTCVFVSKALNNFLTDRSRYRGEWPLGVHYHKQSAKYQAMCSNPFNGKKETLGCFLNPEDAHEAWRKRKHEHACRYADMQTDQRIADALRVRYAKSGGQDE